MLFADIWHQTCISTISLITSVASQKIRSCLKWKCSVTACHVFDLKMIQISVKISRHFSQLPVHYAVGNSLPSLHVTTRTPVVLAIHSGGSKQTGLCSLIKKEKEKTLLCFYCKQYHKYVPPQPHLLLFHCFGLLPTHLLQGVLNVVALPSMKQQRAKVNKTLEQEVKR